MRFEELFHEATLLDEPPPPVDVVGQVRRRERRRRVATLSVGAPLALLAVLVLVVVLPSRGGPAPAPDASSSPTTGAPPGTFFAVMDGRAVEESGTGMVNDFGPAVAVAPSSHGVWVARSTGTCRSKVERVDASTPTSFVPNGSVNDLAVSPDGRWLAYGRGGTRPDPRAEGGGCGPDSLVIRDLRTSAERVWSGSGGGVSSLSWSPDSSRLVFQTVVCCTADTTIYDLDTSSAPATIDRIPTLPGVSAIDGQVSDPTFAGDQVLVLVDNPAGTAQDYRVATSTGQTVALLQDMGVSLDADATGQHLLVSLYGSPELNGNLLSITRGKDPIVLGRGYERARW